MANIEDWLVLELNSSCDSSIAVRPDVIQLAPHQPLPDSLLASPVSSTSINQPQLIPSAAASTSHVHKSSSYNVMTVVNYTSSSLPTFASFYAPATQPDSAWIVCAITIAITALLPVLGLGFHPLRRRSWFVNVALFFVAETASHLLSLSLLVFVPRAVGVNLASHRIAFVRVVCLIFVALFVAFNLELLHCQSKPSRQPSKKKQRNSKSTTSDNKNCTCWTPKQTPTNSLPSLHPPPASATVTFIDDDGDGGVGDDTTTTTTTPLRPDDPSLPKKMHRARSKVVSDFRYLGGSDQWHSASGLLYVFADSVASLVDGMRVGVALRSLGVVLGSAVALVILTEQLPRKVGGVLLLGFSASLSIGHAVAVSLIPSCFVFAGFVTGVFALPSPSHLRLVEAWSYAVVAAFILHVALVSVFPQLLRTCITTTTTSQCHRRRHRQLIFSDEAASLGIDNSALKEASKRRVVSTCRALVVNLAFLIGFAISVTLFIFAETLPYMNELYDNKPS